MPLESRDPNTEPATDSDPPGTPAEYVVVARRYRPQSFTELIGQETVGRALSNAITSNRVGHAYLFTGARGVGKTSTARILAKALDCVRGPTPQPCNECDICQSISTGDDIDVLEIDGASNRGIDEIRELRQNVNVRPSRARFKIYIIDEVHMLTAPAFNALLKTLEEPPEHVKFIFCTTEPEKIPITILSRCQRFDFAGIETDAIAARLAQIAAAEGVQAEPESLELLARKAAGSMRDSQSLLEQLLAFGGKTLTAADVHALLGTAAGGRLAALATQMAAGNAAGVLAEFDAALHDGVDPGQLLNQLLGFFRDALVAAVGGRSEQLLYSGPAEKPAVAEVSQRLGIESLLAAMQIIDHALGRMRYSSQGRTLAELALVRIARLENLAALADLLEQARHGDLPALDAQLPQPDGSGAKKKSAELIGGSGHDDGGQRVSAVPLSEVGEGNGNASHGRAAEREAIPQHSASLAPSASIALSSSAVQTDKLATEPVLAAQVSAAAAEFAGSPDELWKQVLARLPDTTADFAKHAGDVAISAPKRLVATFPSQYSYSRSMCERPDRFGRIVEILEELAGPGWKLELVLAAETAAPPVTQSPAPERRQDRIRAAAERPLVRRAMELLNASPTRIEEVPGVDPGSLTPGY
ncbi:MAG: DNA polymerase III subunit gamma/tau [Pirellulales bacterium]|nr:DNA polymerase III subunit gamma/tau [Pirellulales bacterium]